MVNNKRRLHMTLCQSLPLEYLPLLGHTYLAFFSEMVIDELHCLCHLCSRLLGNSGPCAMSTRTVSVSSGEEESSSCCNYCCVRHHSNHGNLVCHLSNLSNCVCHLSNCVCHLSIVTMVTVCHLNNHSNCVSP